MGEVGCLKDGHFQNLQVESALFDITAAEFTGSLAVSGELTGYRKEVLLQTVFTTALALTVAQSGAIVLLNKNEATAITLPEVTANDIGVEYTFVQTLTSALDRTINTKYDNDYFTGSLTVLPLAVWGSGTAQDGLATYALANAAADTQITFDDDLQNGMGAVGSSVTCTAILTGNVAAGGGAKVTWLVTGNVFTVDPNSNGTAIFT